MVGSKRNAASGWGGGERKAGLLGASGRRLQLSIPPRPALRGPGRAGRAPAGRQSVGSVRGRVSRRRLCLREPVRRGGRRGLPPPPFFCPEVAGRGCFCSRSPPWGGGSGKGWVGAEPPEEAVVEERAAASESVRRRRRRRRPGVPGDVALSVERQLVEGG